MTLAAILHLASALFFGVAFVAALWVILDNGYKARTKILDALLAPYWKGDIWEDRA